MCRPSCEIVLFNIVSCKCPLLNTLSMKDSSVPNVLLSGSQKSYAGKNFTKLHVQPIVMSNPLNNSELSIRKLIYNFTSHDTEKNSQETVF